jgi:N-acetylneuraminic acid mutarotase
MAACSDWNDPTAPTAATDQPLAAPELALASNAWTSKANMPTARFALAAGVVNNSAGQPVLYAIGGRSANGSLTKVEAYNFATNIWTTKASLPVPLYHTNGVGLIGGKLYLSGGVATGGTDPRRGLYIYAPNLNTWTRKRDMPQALSHGVTGVINGKLYVHGLASSTTRLLRYDPATNAWESLPAAPERHMSGAGGVINGKFYVAGGIPASGRLHMFDPATKRWTARAPMPGARRWDVAGTVFQGKLYIIGGQEGGKPLRTVQAYDPVSDTWSTSTSMPTARMAAAAARVILSGQPQILTVGGTALNPLKTNEAYGPGQSCKEHISLLAGAFAIATQANTCTIGIVQAGEYLAIPFFPEVQLPTVGTVAELPRTSATLRLIGGAAPLPVATARLSLRAHTLASLPRPYLSGAIWHGPDFFSPASGRVRAGLTGLPCVTPTVGSPLLLPTTRRSSGEFAGYYQDIGGPLETWRVARVTPEAVVVIDSAFWRRLPTMPAAQGELVSLTEGFKTSVLPTMVQFGIARKDWDGDGRTLILVPETPVGANAYAGFWGSDCATAAEGILIPTSRFQGSPINPASMADALSAMMHEMFHLFEWGARPSNSVWYASEGTARLAEHVWRVATSSGGSPFTARRPTLPIGSYAGVSQQATTAESPSKHCVDPTLDGFDYLRIPANIRAYDTGCWFAGRLAAAFKVRGVADNMIFPSLVSIAHQGTMVDMWNEVSGESRTPTGWRARWLAAIALEGSGVSPSDPTIRHPMWDLARVIQSSAYALESRFLLAPPLDAQTTSASWEIVDQSAQAARLRVLAGGELVLRNGSGGFFGLSSALQLLLVRLK